MEVTRTNFFTPAALAAAIRLTVPCSGHQTVLRLALSGHQLRHAFSGPNSTLSGP